jgi:hypothetical protein
MELPREIGKFYLSCQNRNYFWKKSKLRCVLAISNLRPIQPLNLHSRKLKFENFLRKAKGIAHSRGTCHPWLPFSKNTGTCLPAFKLLNQAAGDYA